LDGAGASSAALIGVTTLAMPCILFGELTHPRAQRFGKHEASDAKVADSEI
jgi:hypothetical protein